MEEELLSFLESFPPPTEQGQGDSEVVLLASTSGVAPARPQPSGASCTDVSPAAAQSTSDEVQPPPAKRGYVM